MPSAQLKVLTGGPKAALRTESKPGVGAESDHPSLYLNPELSLLEFQRRVLEEARDTRNPLLERVKFLAILSSNLDEFFMVRVAGLLQQIENGVQDASIDGRQPGAQLAAIRTEVTRLIGEAYVAYREELLPALANAGITINEYSSLHSSQQAQLQAHFMDSIYPVLTPLAFDPGRPFPHISNLSLNLAVVVRDSHGAEHFARVKAPDSLTQLMPVPKGPWPSAGDCFVWVEQVILANLHLLFPGLEIVEAHPFHVTRDAEVAIKELESDDLLATIEEAVWQRRFRDVVRLVVDRSMPEPLLRILTSNLEIEPSGIYRVDGPLDLGRLRQLASLDRPDLKDRPFLAQAPTALVRKDGDYFAAIRQEDILLHHPFDSFQPVVEFLQQAARDPGVLAIKMTLYRLGRNSPIVDALLEAVRNGKQVAVVVELKARFDEATNIRLAELMEESGVHVTYGVVGLKTHCKVILVVRQDYDGLRRYVHIGTGNYHAETARIYSDVGMFTCGPTIGQDVTELFNYLTTGYKAKRSYSKLVPAPKLLKTALLTRIEREIATKAEKGEGLIQFKMNALEDGDIVRALYRASMAGVKVWLFVRDTCRLRPGIPRLSENIRVISIVGRFLEHARIYYFKNGGAEEYFISSADAMKRNLEARVEILCPVELPELTRELRQIFDTYSADQRSSWEMQQDGTYVQHMPADTGSCEGSHQMLIALAGKRLRRSLRRKKKSLMMRD